MQVVGIILLLVSVGLVVGPVGAVVVIYQDDLSGLVIPPEIQNLMSGNGSFLLDGSNNGDGISGLLNPVFVSATADQASRTFTVTVNFTNNLNYDLTLNALNATAQDNQNHNQLATITLNNAPVAMPSGETTQVTVSGSWTQQAEQSYFEGQTINVSLINVSINVNGIIVQPTESINVGAVQLTLVGTQ